MTTIKCRLCEGKGISCSNGSVLPWTHRKSVIHFMRYMDDLYFQSRRWMVRERHLLRAREAELCVNNRRCFRRVDRAPLSHRRKRKAQAVAGHASSMSKTAGFTMRTATVVAGALRTSRRLISFVHCCAKTQNVHQFVVGATDTLGKRAEETYRQMSAIVP